MAVNKSGIYQLLENRLKATGETPLTCGELYEFPEIRELARDANRVSDYLGHMWRRGVASTLVPYAQRLVPEGPVRLYVEG